MVENRPWLNFFTHLILILGVIVVVFPVYVAFVASTQTAVEVEQAPMSLLPGAHFIENYMQILTEGGGTASRAPVGRMLFVSLMMAMGISIGKILISLVSAFAIVYFRFPGRKLCFWLIFITLMLPVEVRISPTYEVMADLHLLDSWGGLILPVIASATATFLFRQFFLTVPDELTEAARMDGAGEFYTFNKIVLPIMKPALAVQAIFSFVASWLEPVPVAAACDHVRGHVPDRDRHQAHDRRRRLRQRMEPHHGDGHACNDPARHRGDRHAALVRQGPRRHGKVRDRQHG